MKLSKMSVLKLQRLFSAELRYMEQSVYTQVVVKDNESAIAYFNRPTDHIPGGT
jgi:hypothetical protein